jgi:hypothetical protein
MRTTLLSLFLLAAVASSSLALRAEPGDSPAAAPAIKPNAGERLREGTQLVDQAGKFEFAGDRVAFFPNGSSDSYRVLENLALERISRILNEGRGKQAWILSGTLTEFRGSNYLLITKAVLCP